MLSRVLAALVGLLIVLPVLIFGGQPGAELIVGLVVLIGLDEYAGMAFPDARRWAFGVLLLPSVALYAAALHGPPGSVLAAGVLSALGMMCASLFREQPVEQAADTAARLVFGLVWVTGLLTFLPLLRAVDQGMTWVFFALGVTWLGDTGGYFAGRFFGRHKLYERISPKKTWEGLVGGVLLSGAGALVIRELGALPLGIAECVVLAVVLDLAGVVGDLVESMVKRSFGVKDSGWIMPGHGGILDRVDALLFTVPLLWLYLVWSAGL